MSENHNVFTPGCALLLYKPELADKLWAALKLEPGFEDAPIYNTCCHSQPETLAAGTRVVTVCSGCHRRYRSLYENTSAVSLWEILAQSEAFPFPDYGGAEITIHDTCPTRKKQNVTDAVRVLLKRMNLKLVEPELTGADGICCGDSFYGKLPKAEVLEKMRLRADGLPCGDVAVYCVSCIQSMHNGGKKPRYMADLLFGEDTVPGETDIDVWHSQLDAFIESH